MKSFTNQMVRDVAYETISEFGYPMVCELETMGIYDGTDLLQLLEIFAARLGVAPSPVDLAIKPSKKL